MKKSLEKTLILLFKTLTFLVFAILLTTIVTFLVAIYALKAEIRNAVILEQNTVTLEEIKAKLNTWEVVEE